MQCSKPLRRAAGRKSVGFTGNSAVHRQQAALQSKDHSPQRSTRNKLLIAATGIVVIGAAASKPGLLQKNEPQSVEAEQQADASVSVPQPVVDNSEMEEVRTQLDEQIDEVSRKKQVYRDKVLKLQEDNDSLTFKTRRLAEENLELTNELLKLELEALALQAEAANAEPRIVYSYVDVPIGQSVESANQKPTSRPSMARSAAETSTIETQDSGEQNPPASDIIDDASDEELDNAIESIISETLKGLAS